MLFFNAYAGGNSLVEGVLALTDFRYVIGLVQEGLRGIAAGHDDFQLFGLVLEKPEDFLFIQKAEGTGTEYFVEDEQVRRIAADAVLYFLKETALHGLGSSQFIRGHLEGEFLTAFAAQYGDGRDAR